MNFECMNAMARASSYESRIQKLRNELGVEITPALKKRIAEETMKEDFVYVLGV